MLFRMAVKPMKKSVKINLNVMRMTLSTQFLKMKNWKMNTKFLKIWMVGIGRFPILNPMQKMLQAR